MNFNFVDIFFIIVFFQLLFISVFLFTHERGKRLSNRLLAFFFLSICLNLVDYFLFLNKMYLYNPAWVGWGTCLPLLFGPLLYLYTQSILIKDFSLTPKRYWHFLPFILVFLFTEIGFLVQPSEIKYLILNKMVAHRIPVAFYWVSAGIFLQFFLYTGASLRLIGQYKKIATDKFSDQQRTNISWLSSTIVFFACCMVIAVLNGFIGLTPLANYYYFIFITILFAIFIFINRVLMKALKRPEIFSVMEESESSLQPETGRAKYQVPGLKEEDKKDYLKKILDFMETDKPFIDPELTLDQLAALLSLRPKVLSRVINELLSQNFFEFVNAYRIEEAKRLLTHPADKKITVLEVLYEVGFNSKSSFNTLFKKHTGLTPSEFKRKHLQD